MPNIREQAADTIRETLSSVYDCVKIRTDSHGKPSVWDMERRIMESFPGANERSVSAHLFAIRMHLEALSVELHNGER